MTKSLCLLHQASVAKVIKRAVGESVKVGKEAKVNAAQRVIAAAATEGHT